MTTSAEYVRAAQSGKGLVEVCDCTTAPACRPVLLATDEKRRHSDRPTLKRSQIFPVAVHIPIAIESTRESRPLKLVDIKVQVLCRQPWRQLLREGQTVPQFATGWNGGHRLPILDRRRIARSAVVEA